MGCVVQLRESQHSDPHDPSDGQWPNGFNLVNAGFAQNAELDQYRGMRGRAPVRAGGQLKRVFTLSGLLRAGPALLLA